MTWNEEGLCAHCTAIVPHWRWYCEDCSGEGDSLRLDLWLKLIKKPEPEAKP